MLPPGFRARRTGSELVVLFPPLAEPRKRANDLYPPRESPWRFEEHGHHQGAVLRENIPRRATASILRRRRGKFAPLGLKTEFAGKRLLASHTFQQARNRHTANMGEIDIQQHRMSAEDADVILEGLSAPGFRTRLQREAGTDRQG